jgi:hypothetical protein
MDVRATRWPLCPSYTSYLYRDENRATMSREAQIEDGKSSGNGVKLEPSETPSCRKWTWDPKCVHLHVHILYLIRMILRTFKLIRKPQALRPRTTVPTSLGISRQSNYLMQGELLCRLSNRGLQTKD